MHIAQDGDVVFDTTIYYKGADRVRRWLDQHGLKIYFTPNNAIELMTPDPSISSADFDKRKQAVRNLLDLANGGEQALPDTELLHTERLGYQIVSSGDWQEVARRFLVLPDAKPTSWKNVGLNLQPAIDAVTAGYGAFVDKVERYQKDVHTFWTANKEGFREKGITYSGFRDINMMRAFTHILDIRPSIMASHMDRICAVAKELNLSGALVEPSQYEQAVGVYVNTYAGYVRYSLVTERRDKNDFGDLQFFAYCDAGYRLVSSEGRWNDISAQEGLENHFIQFR